MHTSYLEPGALNEQGARLKSLLWKEHTCKV